MTALAPARRAIAATLAAAALTAIAAVPAAAATPSVAIDRPVGHPAAPSLGESARLAYQKSVAVRVLKGVFERGDTEVVDRFVRPDYIQHNPQLPDGPEALKALGVSLHQQYPDARVDIKRIIAEGDLVIIHHNSIQTPGTRGMAIVDIFRFQGGKIAEHWDSIQDVPATSVNGNDMFSTVTQPATEPQRQLTEYNKKLVTTYYKQLLVDKDLSAIDKYVAPEYHQHNPNIADGSAGLKDLMVGFLGAFPQLKVTTTKVVAEGDLVALQSHYVNVPGERGTSFMDIFLVRDGKIVEHWDVVQDVPETSANDNTMF